MKLTGDQISSGRAWPLGAQWDGDGVNFALFSANAEQVELCLFDESGDNEIQRVVLPAKTDDVWHVRLHDAGPGLLYGYRVYGPYDPVNGHRFNHHKLLLDPYARSTVGTYRESDENYGYIKGSPEGDLSFDTRDNAHNIPKCVVVDEQSKRPRSTGPKVDLLDSVIYEAHPAGLTQRLPGLSKRRRGTYGALASKKVIAHLRELGVTTIELLPVHAFCDEEHLLQKGLVNYWGYNSLLFFAPATRYAHTDARREFRRMVRALHVEGFEVVLDVVYNHTAEGNEHGPTLCYRGIDNASYYRLQDYRRYYINDTGCGNTINSRHPRVNQLIMDSLRYWVSQMQVDGFRFDLAPVLGRESWGFDRGAGFFDSVRQDPVLAGTKMIAEPWDTGPGGYQLGQFPQGWSEWNDEYRDSVRSFWRGDAHQLQALARALHGSSDKFEWQQRGPVASINFITSHDGFTLRDLVSYNERHNEANGEYNRDGHSHNISYNHGVEGPTDDAAINAERDLHRRNLMATLLLSQGVPMLVAGDEFGRTQHGNNNAYCQNNPLGWIDWSQATTDHAFLAFTQRLISLRRQLRGLRRSRYLHGTQQSPSLGVPDIVWLGADGSPMEHNEWHRQQAGFLGMLIPGDSGCDMARAAGVHTQSCEHILIVINHDSAVVHFPLPEVPTSWVRRLDTCQVEQSDENVMQVSLCHPRSIQLLTCQG